MAVNGPAVLAGPNQMGSINPGFNRQLTVSSETMMEDVRVLCKKCGQVFAPSSAASNLITIRRVDKSWHCPRCTAKNPNLIRHYRGFFVVGLLIIFFNARSTLVSGLPQEAKLIGWGVLGFLTVLVMIAFFIKKPWESYIANGCVLVLVLLFAYAALKALFADKSVIYGSASAAATASDQGFIAGKLIFLGIILLFLYYAAWVSHIAPRKYLVEEKHIKPGHTDETLPDSVCDARQAFLESIEGGWSDQADRASNAYAIAMAEAGFNRAGIIEALQSCGVAKVEAKKIAMKLA